MILDGIQTRIPDIVISSCEGSFAIVLVSFGSDRVQAVTASVGTCYFESLANDRLSKDLVEGEMELFVEGELRNPGLAILVSMR